MSHATAAEAKCQCSVLDFDLSKQKCSPTSASGRSESESSEVLSFEINRSRGKRVVCVYHYDNLSVFDGHGKGLCQILGKIRFQATL